MFAILYSSFTLSCFSLSSSSIFIFFPFFQRIANSSIRSRFGFPFVLFKREKDIGTCSLSVSGVWLKSTNLSVCFPLFSSKRVHEVFQGFPVSLSKCNFVGSLKILCETKFERDSLLYVTQHFFSHLRNIVYIFVVHKC